MVSAVVIHDAGRSRFVRRPVRAGFPPGSPAQQPPTGPPVHIPSEERFTERELLAFARAYPAVKDLTAQHRSGKKDPTSDFTAERAGLIEEHGLSQDRYNRIATAMNRDPRLHDRIQRLIDEAEHAGHE